MKVTILHPASPIFWICNYALTKFQKNNPKLIKSTTNYLVANDGMTSEFDMSINDISRDKADAMYRENNRVCYLGKINLYGNERKKEFKLVKYTPEKKHETLTEDERSFIYNFEFAFCLPVYDAELERMINDRDNAPYNGTSQDSVLVGKIMDRITVLKGVNLFWS